MNYETIFNNIEWELAKHPEVEDEVLYPLSVIREEFENLQSAVEYQSRLLADIAAQHRPNPARIEELADAVDSIIDHEYEAALANEYITPNVVISTRALQDLLRAANKVVGHA